MANLPTTVSAVPVGSSLIGLDGTGAFFSVPCSPNWRGPWQPNVSYFINDGVTIGGFAYVASSAIAASATFAGSPLWVLYAGSLLTISSLAMLLGSLPTAPPIGAGQLWMNSGVLTMTLS